VKYPSFDAAMLDDVDPLATCGETEALARDDLK
jgi:hypothetical protein